MQVTVNIPDELVAAALADGMTPEAYLLDLIDNAARNRPKHIDERPRRMRMQTFLQEMSAYSEKIPQLPDEAFTRESFYRDHD